MALESLLAADTPDDRIEISNLFRLLSPEQRMRFLDWSVSRSSLPTAQVLPDDPKAGLTADEAAHALYLIATHLGLDLPRACRALEFYVRTEGRRTAPPNRAKE